MTIACLSVRLGIAPSALTDCSGEMLRALVDVIEWRADEAAQQADRQKYGLGNG